MNNDEIRGASEVADASGVTVDPVARAALQLQLEAEKERYRRLAADFNSFRQRTARDSEQRAAAQKDAFIRDFLIIIDNLERALIGDAHPASDSLRRGIEMTLEQSLALLRRHGIEADGSAGEVFDPHRHEAINARFDPDQEDHVVLDIVQRGYRRGDEIIRPARVTINDYALAGRAGQRP